MVLFIVSGCGSNSNSSIKNNTPQPISSQPQNTSKVDTTNLKAYKMDNSYTKDGIKITFTELQINNKDIGLHITIDNLSRNSLKVDKYPKLIVNRYSYMAAYNRYKQSNDILNIIEKDTKMDFFITIADCPIKIGDDIFLRLSFTEIIPGSFLLINIDAPVKLPDKL